MECLMRTAKEAYKILSKRLYIAVRNIIPSQKEKLRLERLVGPIGKWDRLQKFQLSALLKNRHEPHHSLLDVGCDPHQGGIAFIQHLDKNKYVGIDLRDAPLQEAYQ